MPRLALPATLLSPFSCDEDIAVRGGVRRMVPRSRAMPDRSDTMWRPTPGIHASVGAVLAARRQYARAQSASRSKTPSSFAHLLPTAESASAREASVHVISSTLDAAARGPRPLARVASAPAFRQSRALTHPPLELVSRPATAIRHPDPTFHALPHTAPAAPAPAPDAVHLAVPALATSLDIERSAKPSDASSDAVAKLAVAGMRQLPALDVLSEETLFRMARLGKLQRQGRYQHIYHEGARPDGLFVLVHGSARLASLSDRRGRLLLPPAVFGLEALAALGPASFSASPTSAVRLESAVAIQPCACVHIRREIVATAIEELAVASSEPPHAAGLAVGGG